MGRRLCKWQLGAAMGEAVWQGRKGLRAAAAPVYRRAKLVSQPLGWWKPGKAQQAGRVSKPGYP